MLEHENRLKFLVLEDEKAFAKKVSNVFSPRHDVYCVPSISEGKKKLKEEAFDVCIIDYRLTDGTGLDFLKVLKEVAFVGIKIFLTGNANPELKRACLQNGADDYISKSTQYESDLLIRIQAILKEKENDQKLQRLCAIYKDSCKYDFIGESRLVKDLKKSLRNLRNEHFGTLLITGPSGSGKKLAARELNSVGNKNRPFIKVSCESVDVHNFERDFCGYCNEYGIFKPGYFDLAEGGDLILDEVSELSLAVQKKICSIIEDGEYASVGSSKAKNLQVRVIATTSKDLQRLSSQRSFSRDFFQILKFVTLKIPPMAQRIEDIPLLARYFLVKHGSSRKTISEDVLEAFSKYDWPGNVRELEHAIQDAYSKARQRSSQIIEMQDISKTKINLPMTDFFPESPAEVSRANYEEFMQSAEKTYFAGALRLFNGNASELAKCSGIPLSTINLKIGKYRLRESYPAVSK